MQIRFYLVIVMLIVLLSCENNKIYEEVRDDGSKFVLEYMNINDSSSYIKKYYYPTGELNYIGEVIKGKKQGKWTWYYMNGNKKDEAYFDDGLYYRERKHWYEDGKPKLFEYLSDYEYKDSCCDCTGRFVHFLKNGAVQENNKVDGVFEGKLIQWYPNGAKNYEGLMKNGVENGKWTYYDTLGHVSYFEYYELGKLIRTQ